MSDATYAASNVVYTALSDFVDSANGDFHPASRATEEPGASISAAAMRAADADGKARNLAQPTVGAYER